MFKVSSPSFLLSIIVPCHNSENFIEDTIGYLHSQLNPNEELILVENGSNDNTSLVLKTLFGGKSKNVTVIESSKGLGIALKLGIEHAQGETIVFMEDDLPFGLQELNLARKMNTNGKYIILSKYHGNIHGLGFRKIQGLVFKFLREAVLRLRVKDSQATFFGDARLVKQLGRISQQKGFLVTLELIALARKLEVDILEIPCDSLAKPIRPTTVRLRDVFQMVIGLFQVKQLLKELNGQKSSGQNFV
jgi:dolichyl-phosphate beta-glucosyltransferase